MVAKANGSEESFIHSLVRQWHTLPKPLLFGIYGAIGGLLGVLFVGEILWVLTRPAVAQATPLQLSASSEMTVYYGGSNQIGIKIARDHLKGSVIIEAVQPPDGIDVPSIIIPEGSDDGDLTLFASLSEDTQPLPRDVELELSARSVDFPGATATASVAVRIEPLPASLHMTASPDVRLYVGGTNRLVVKLGRQNFAGRVRLSAVTPDGIQIQETLVPPGSNEAELMVAAKGRFVVGRPYPVRLRAEYAKNPKIAAELSSTLWVDQPPPHLAVAVSPQVVLYPANKNKFSVKISRQGFEGAVIVEAGSLPAHLRIAPIVIPEDRTEGEMEATVTEAKGDDFFRDHRLPIRATVQARRGLDAECNLNLRIEPVPPAVNFSISPEVGVLQGGKGLFTVKLARRGFDAPVRIDFAGAPMGAVFPSVVVPVGQTEAEVTLTTLFKTPAGKQKMTASATADSLANLRSETSFFLDVRPNKRKIPEVDIVFMLDVTASMTFAINGVRGGIQRFAEQLKDAEIDSRIGLLAFRDLIADRTNEPMKQLMFDGKPFTTDAAAFGAEVANLRAAGGGDEPESSLEATVLAARLPFRPSATKILILITDASPKGVANPFGALPNIAVAAKNPVVVATQQALLDTKIDQLHLVTRTNHRQVYELIQQAAKDKGTFFSIENAAKGTQKFEDLMPVLSKEIVGTTTTKAVPVASAKAPAPPESGLVKNLLAVPAPIPLGSALPKPPETKEVAPPQPAAMVVPPSPARPTLQAVQSTAAYTRESRWQLVAAIALWTATMAGSISLVLVVGQRFYISRTFIRLSEFAKALSGGILAGLVAGALGQLIFDSTAGGTLWTAISRAFAWGFLGACLGAGMGLFVPNLRWIRSLAGGLMGGVVGAFAFTFLSLIVGAVLGRWLGATIVGFFIGIMVAFAEIAFRRVWLEIAFGKLEVRVVSLGSSPVLIGAHRQATIHVESEPPLAFAYRIEEGGKNQVLCENLVSRQTVAVHPGEERTLGKVTITVRSAESARHAGFTLKLSDGRSIPLKESMPLTAEDLPGLAAKGKDGVVLLVSAHPREPGKLLLQNRSLQAWTIKTAEGTQKTIASGGSVGLAANLQIQFGQVVGILIDTRAETQD